MFYMYICKMVSGGSTATCKGNCHNSTNSTNGDRRTSSRIKASGALTFPLRNRWGSVEPDSRALVPKWSHERAAISYHDMHVPMHTNSHALMAVRRWDHAVSGTVQSRSSRLNPYLSARPSKSGFFHFTFSRYMAKSTALVILDGTFPPVPYFDKMNWRY